MRKHLTILLICILLLATINEAPIEPISSNESIFTQKLDKDFNNNILNNSKPNDLEPNSKLNLIKNNKSIDNKLNDDIISNNQVLFKGPSLADSPWPMFRYNIRHTGQSPYNTSDNPGKLKWSFKTGSYVLSSPAIGFDGTIYIGSFDENLYAINPNGTLKWNYKTGSSIYSSATIGSDGIIYIGSDDKKLYAIYPNGTEKWNIKFKDIVQSSPMIGKNGTIFIGSNDFNFYAINPNGTEKWNFTTKSYIGSSSAIDKNGIVYFGSWDGNVYAINPLGNQKWNFQTGGSISSSPTIGNDGTIYIGSCDGKIYAINSNGTQKWNFTTEGWVGSSPAIGPDGTIYVGSLDHKLYAINPNGTQKWNFSVMWEIDSSPAVCSNGIIYFGSRDGCLYAISPNGTQKWIFKTGNMVYSCPAIGSDGTIYVGSHDGNLYAIGKSTSNQPPIISSFRATPAPEGSKVYFTVNVSDPDNDTLIYSYDFQNDGICDMASYNNSTYYIWPDDHTGNATVHVSDGKRIVNASTEVVVYNVAPKINLSVYSNYTSTNISANLSVRIAGEKWHDVKVELLKDDNIVTNGTLIRSPGSPNEQMLHFHNQTIYSSSIWTAVLYYTPDDDPVNGQKNGATPCWIILNLSNSKQLKLHHTFKVKHTDTHIWRVNLTSALPSDGNTSNNVTFIATIYDPGADDISLYLDFGDGTNITKFYPNNNLTFPVLINFTIIHKYLSTGKVNVILIAKDDDGGISTIKITIDFG